VWASLLEGNNVLLSSAESLEAASAFVDVEDGDEVIARFGTLAVSWGCIKCCYHEDCGCCPPDDPPDPKDPDGD